jgi:ABC-type transporter Mla subunit MlaD
MLSIDTKKALAAVLENLNKASSEVPAFVQVTDSTYIRRLEKALTKNFDYIRRLLETVSSQHLQLIRKILPTAIVSDLMTPEMT